MPDPEIPVIAAPSPIVDVAPVAPVAPEPAAAAVPSVDPGAAQPIAAEAPAPAEPTRQPTLLEKALAGRAKPVEPAKPGAEAATEPAKPGDAAQPEPPQPVAYDFKLPEGVTVSKPEALAEVTGIFRDLGIPPEKAQGLIDRHVSELQAFAAQTEEAASRRQWDVWNDTQRAWEAEVLADPELGGAGHDTAMQRIADVRDQFVPDKDRAAFEQFLSVTGAGSHPAFLRFVNNVAKWYTEPPPPSVQIRPPPQPRGKGGRGGMYPKMRGAMGK
jgi:hypothetical protein